MFRYASELLDSLKNPIIVKKVLSKKRSVSDPMFAALNGALSSISQIDTRGDITIELPEDEKEHIISQANHYVNVLSKKEKQKLSDKDFLKISELVKLFIPSKKQRKGKK